MEKRSREFALARLVMGATKGLRDQPKLELLLKVLNEAVATDTATIYMVGKTPARVADQKNQSNRVFVKTVEKDDNHIKILLVRTDSNVSSQTYFNLATGKVAEGKPPDKESIPAVSAHVTIECSATKIAGKKGISQNRGREFSLVIKKPN